MERCRAALHVDARDGAFAQTDVRLITLAVVTVTREEMVEEARDVGVVADDHDVLVGRTLVEEALELWVGGAGRERVGYEDGGLVSGFGADELRSLQAALERAGDDEIEVDGEGVEDVRKLDALALAVFIERAFDVNSRIGAACACTGVTKYKQVHARSFSDLVGP